MKRIFTFFFSFLYVSLFSTTTGHFPTTPIVYSPPTGFHYTSYTINPNGRQSTLSLNTAQSNIPANGKADIYVNFMFDTSGKNVFVVYTTNGTAPTKTNGTVVNAVFSLYSDPDRWWIGQIPEISQGTTVSYIIYISDSNLASAWGRIGVNGYVTSWSEGDDNGFQYTVEAALPIELTKIDIQKFSFSNSLHWSTATELNNSHFDIQRSADSKNWETIGTVQGNGTTLEPQEYRYTDRQPLPGINYYRLKQVDYDGQYEYSKVVSVDFGKGTRPGVLSPNPVGSELFLSLPEETDGAVSVTVFDLNGRIWQQKDHISNSLDVRELPQGIYFVKLLAENGRVLLQERFVKE